MSAQRTETETKLFQNSFVSVSFRCAGSLKFRSPVIWAIRQLSEKAPDNSQK